MRGDPREARDTRAPAPVAFPNDPRQSRIDPRQKPMRKFIFYFSSSDKLLLDI